ncbi:VWA domain-containing protein [Piscibacillus halophilus]|uniref:VWA domain-containing protein n=1 Tax=Piscibacillus halophilus TaxID=571933 RepID=UPI002409D6B7|nr:VWA domain-containing protein [Piscibacillus halophilus]
MFDSYMKRYYYVLIIIFCFILVGCNSDAEEESSVNSNESNEIESEEGGESENETGASDEEKTDDTTNASEENFFSDLPQTPNSIEELLSLPPGKFAGKTYEEQQEEIEEVLDQFPVSEEEISDEEAEKYWLKLVGLFAEEYPNPQDVLEQWGGYSINPPEIDGEEISFKENYNVEIILDASGSMANYQGDQTRMELAKEAIMDYAKELPEEANVGLRIYGFEGSNADSDKKVSCSSNELVYGIKPFNEKELSEVMDDFGPTGWTPLAEAIAAAKSDLAEFDGENNTNIIYIVSDGIETCDGNPVEEAKSLADSNITPVVNVIGFNLDHEGQKQLKEVAEAAKGTYKDVQNRNQLQDEFQKAAKIASEWRLWRAHAMGDARMENVDRANMMRDFRAEWTDRYRNERHSLSEAIKYLQYEIDALSLDAALKIGDFRDERTNKLHEWKAQAWDDLSEVKDKDYEDAVDEIQGKYKDNASDDN